MKIFSSRNNHNIRKTMTYKELYDMVINDPKYRSIEDKVSGMAQFIYSYGYKGDRYVTPEDAVWIALELLEDMTGRYWDCTHDEFSKIVDKIIG